MRKHRIPIGERPSTSSDAEHWIQRGSRDNQTTPSKREIYSARLTLDVTPQLRGRIKLAAIAAGVTAAELLRALLERECPERERDV